MLRPCDDMIHAALVIAENKVNVLPVVEHGNYLGVFSLSSLAHKNPFLADTVFKRFGKEVSQCGDELGRSMQSSIFYML